MARFAMGFLIAGICGGVVSARGDEPLERIREASAASLSGLTSGSGRGMFRQYESVGGGEWQLTVDAEITTHFTGRDYYVELIYNPEVRGIKCRRILRADRSLRTAWFSPGWLTRGQVREMNHTDYGDGLTRPSQADFPWDVSALPLNVWNVERLVKQVAPQKIEVVENSEGDLIGSYSTGTDGSRVRFECPKRFGFNVARIQFPDPVEGLPPLECRIEWKQAESSHWFVRSIQHEWLIRNREPKRIRQVLKYSDFKPNVKVDASIFTTEYLEMPMAAKAPGDGPPRVGK